LRLARLPAPTLRSPLSLHDALPISLMVAHVAGARPEARKRQTTLFVLGMAMALSVTGMVAGLLGKSLLFAAPWIRWIAGIAFIIDRKSTRLNSSHVKISYAVFCLKK